MPLSDGLDKVHANMQNSLSILQTMPKCYITRFDLRYNLKAQISTDEYV